MAPDDHTPADADEINEKATPSADDSIAPAPLDTVVAPEPLPSPAAVDQRIQFAPSVRRDRGRTGRVDGGRINEKRRGSSVTSIPRVPDKSERKRAAKQKKDGEEEKKVDIDEHLMSAEDVAARYKTRIDLKKPGDSGGLTSEAAEQVLGEVGRNVLTPPKKRHPFLKYLDCLRSLFNLLLILAGVLEYILLGIDFKDNFQNVSDQTLSA
jgi:sodium/potassium-transporting ATPase subunit alpha